jgi:hypothetical protein
VDPRFLGDDKSLRGQAGEEGAKVPTQDHVGIDPDDLIMAPVQQFDKTICLDIIVSISPRVFLQEHLGE